MKLRSKIILAFVAVILTPMLLLVGSMVAALHFQAELLQENYGISNTNDLMTSDMLKIFVGTTNEVKSDIDAVCKVDPEGLTDEANWESWNTSMLQGSGFLIVIENGEVVFDGCEKPNEELYDALPQTQVDSSDEPFYYLGAPWQYLVHTTIYETEAGDQISIYLLTSVRAVYPQFKYILYEVAIMVVLVLAVTALLLAIWMYSSILKPIATLQKAARSIRDGNLDFSLEITGNDEISELCRDFEDMRMRLKTSAEEKVQADRENKVLISNISHDLKTPLTAVKGYCEGILDGVASTPEKLEKYIHTIYNKANDMQRLLDELTLYSQIDTNRIPYHFTQIHIGDYFSDYAEEMAMDMETRHIELNYSNFLTEDVIVIADGEQLHRVVNNIVSNSIKYMDKKKGLINLRLRDDGDYVRVEIEDNGKGIATADLPFIFDRFYRTDSSRNSSTGGSGIGLSIVKKIIDDHGGKIWATSKEGTGTIMHIALRKYQEVPNE